MEVKGAKNLIPGLGKNCFVTPDEMAPLFKKAMSGDMVFVLTPATCDRIATEAAFQRFVKVSLQTAAGEVHTWFNGDVTISVADTSTAGALTISNADTTPALVNGEVIVALSGSAAAWLADETNTLTVAQQTIMGYTVASKTSVETIIADPEA